MFSATLNARLRNKRFLVAGRAGMDLISQPHGAAIESASHFLPALGGSAGNIAAGLARLDAEVCMLSALSDDAVGRFVRTALNDYGIDTRHVSTVGGQHRTSLAFDECRVQDHQVVIYRNEAADFELDEKQISAIDIDAHDALIVCGTAFAREPSRSLMLALLSRFRSAGRVCILDIDHRPYTWPSLQVAREQIDRAASLADIIVGNDEEFEMLAGGSSAAEASKRAAAGDTLVVLKRGAQGALCLFAGDGLNSGVFDVEALKPTGAGDAFLAAMLAGLSDGLSITSALRQGAAAAALVVQQPGCAPAMPRQHELDLFIASAPTWHSEPV